MKMLLLYSDSGDVFGYVVGLAVAFFVCVFITRWIFGIEKIISSLELQNKYGQAQIRLLTKMLLNQGTPREEIDSILEKGNPRKTDIPKT